jgi:hypothetical protein
MEVWADLGGGVVYDEKLEDIDYAKVKGKRSQTSASISMTTSGLQPIIRHWSDS